MRTVPLLALLSLLLVAGCVTETREIVYVVPEGTSLADLPATLTNLPASFTNVFYAVDPRLTNTLEAVGEIADAAAPIHPYAGIASLAWKVGAGLLTLGISAFAAWKGRGAIRSVFSRK